MVSLTLSLSGCLGRFNELSWLLKTRSSQNLTVCLAKADPREETKILPGGLSLEEAIAVPSYIDSDADEVAAAKGFNRAYLETKSLQEFDGQAVADDIEPDRYYGNTEYKFMLKLTNAERLARLTTQMKFRASEGNGEAFYVIGVKDDGQAAGLPQDQMETSLRILHKMAWTLGLRIVMEFVKKARHGEIAKVRVF